MTRLVTVVCRHNQARSVLAAAAIKRYFPNLEVASAGIEGVEGQRIPQSILNLAEAWGLEVLDTVSHSLQAIQDQLVESDFVVIAEDAFAPHIIEAGVAPQKILSMQDQRFDHSVIPFDPIGQGGQVLSVELAKAIMTAVQLLRAEGSFTHANTVSAILTIDESDLLDKLRLTWETVAETNGVCLVADFRAPNFRAVSNICSGVVEMKVGRFDQRISFAFRGEELNLVQVLSPEGPLTISARFEMDQVEKFVLSVDFTSLVAALAGKCPVTVFTEPFGLGPCAFLVAANGSIGPIFG